MISSGAFELYFTPLGEGPKIKKPLYFHHIPKTAGTSFRASVRAALHGAGGVGSVLVPRIKERMEASGDWPMGLIPIYSAAEGMGHTAALMSHYTSFLADKITSPIVAIVRDPDRHFESSVSFFSDVVLRRLEKTGSVRRTLQQSKINNPQVRSLSGLEVPHFRPRSAEGVQPYLDLVQQLCRRFLIFRVEDYGTLLDHCREEYGLKLTESRKKVATDKRRGEELLNRLAVRSDDEDPVWLDRILYECVLDQSSRP